MKPELERIPFDHFQRYAGAASLVAALGGGARKVLEVGANVQRVLSDFLPTDQIVFSDLVPPADGEDAIDFIQADAARLPFGDATFDAVVSLDVLEHMPVKLRAVAVAEMARVATRLVVAACPIDTPWTSQAEARAQQVWGDFFHTRYPWLAEHEEFGLVDAGVIERAMTDAGLHVIRYGHGDIDVWLGMMSAHFAKEAVDEFKELVGAADYLYNHSIFGGDRSKKAYREFFVGVHSKADLKLVKGAPVLNAAANPAAGHMVRSLGESLRRAALRIRGAEVGLLDANTQKAEAGTQFFLKEAELLARIHDLEQELLDANTRKADEGSRHAEAVRALHARLNATDAALLAANTQKAEIGSQFFAEAEALRARVHALEQDLLAANTQKAQEGQRHSGEMRDLHARLAGVEQALLAANTEKAEAGTRFHADAQALHARIHELEQALLAANTEKADAGTRFHTEVQGLLERIHGLEQSLLVANTIKAEEGQLHFEEVQKLQGRISGIEQALLAANTEKAEAGVRFHAEAEAFRARIHAVEQELLSANTRKAEEAVRAQARIDGLDTDASLLRGRVRALLSSLAEANAEIARRVVPTRTTTFGMDRINRQRAALREISMRRLDQLRSFLSALRHSIDVARANRESPRRVLGRTWAALKLGPKGFVRRVIAYSQYFSEVAVSSAPAPASADESLVYQQWIDVQPQPQHVADPVDGPLISVVMPVFNTPEAFLIEAIASVQAQTYRNWELCLADDGSSEPRVRSILEDACRRDGRISVVWRSQCGGIASATNDAIASASGEYLAFFDHDDLLAPDALAISCVKLLETGADIVYSDHDCVGPDGLRCSPFFKPDWSPDLFLAQMYLGHLTVFRRALVDAVGRLRSDCDGSQDYDLVLRCLQAGASIAHVPKVLYHWRQHSGSTAANPESKPYAHDAGRRAIQHYLDAEAHGAKAEDGAYLFCYDVRYPLPVPMPMVSIIIPTKDRLDLLAPCIDSILERTDYESFEILILDNGSTEQETIDWFKQISLREERVRVIDADVPFNWSRLNNLGVGHAVGDVLVFLNNDTEVITRDWLLRLAENAQRPEIGACGPMLVYPDGTIQHAGVVVGLGGWADHVFKGVQPIHSQNLFVSPALRRNVLAVTGACMAMSRDTFDQLGGFDETFIICGSDVEICLRAHRRGWRNLYLPEVRLVHHESKTRDAAVVPEIDFHRSAEEYGTFRTEGDPLYNPNLDQSSPVPALRLAS